MSRMRFVDWMFGIASALALSANGSAGEPSKPKTRAEFAKAIAISQVNIENSRTLPPGLRLP